jgi:hypothetical protein
MLKTISAALLAASVIVAPAMAASTVKTDVAPATKSAPVTKSEKATPAPDTKASMHKARHIRHAHHIRRHRTPTHAAEVKKQTVAHVVKAQSSVKRISSAKPLAAKVKG